MPRSSIVLSNRPLSGDDVVAAASTVWQRMPGADVNVDAFTARPLDGGAGVQVLAGADVLVTVTRPRPLPDADEVGRLLPTVRTRAVPTWWADAYTPWHPSGRIGLLILDALAERLGGEVVHQDLGEAELRHRTWSAGGDA